jgi:HEAT repeat protein
VAAKNIVLRSASGIGSGRYRRIALVVVTTSKKSTAGACHRMHAGSMLTDTERQAVLDAIYFYNWLPRREIDRVRDQADAELPYELIARAAVEDPEATVRWRAVTLLDHFADHRHDDALVRAAYDRVPRVRRHAVHALGCDVCTRTSSCTDVIPTLIDRATNDDNAKVRRHATFSLVLQIADPRARAALEALARDDSDVRMQGAAVWALDRADRGVTESSS